MKRIILIVSILLTAALAVSLCACSNQNEQAGTEANTSKTVVTERHDQPKDTAAATDKKDAETSEAKPDLPYNVTASLKDAKKGDVVIFGSYEQDGDTGNGSEPLEWLVLDRDGNTLLLITLYAIEQMNFHDSLNTVTWETSAVRAWLNGDFILAAFSPSEAARIKTSDVIAEPNPEFPNSPAGNDTADKVFLLSVQEANRYFEDNAARMCSPTEKLVATGKFTMSKKPWYAKHAYACIWWLRSPGAYKDLYVSSVDKGGSISSGAQVNFAGCTICVRPAVRVADE